jgi:hypothetical protein
VTIKIVSWWRRGLPFGWEPQLKGGQDVERSERLLAGILLAVQTYHEFESCLLRHCCLDKLSLPRRGSLQKPNNGGLFAPDLMTGFAVSEAILLSLRPILSKAVDSRF